jgi:hypothetical protein
MQSPDSETRSGNNSEFSKGIVDLPDSRINQTYVLSYTYVSDYWKNNS